ncbi:hypothetical protein F5Y17DRAFT_456021 [Xylariaceae sp. FL0594]|nr:hypothetical protein F5Y17DRAFT_456021 [Xylariaceae sp. FL0594]
MENLPPELQGLIASFLGTADLKALRLADDPDEQDWWHDPRRMSDEEVPEAVNEVLGCSVAQCVTTFVFDPAYYEKRFWKDYKEYLEGQLETKGAYLAPKSKEQDQMEGKIDAALVKLFEGMPALRKIIVKPWQLACPPMDYDLLNPPSIECPRLSETSIWFLMNKLGWALHRASRSIKSLELGSIPGPLILDNPSYRHVFTGLSELALAARDFSFIAAGAKPCKPVIELVKCALPTLERLSILGGGNFPEFIEDAAEHSLLSILADGPDGTPPLIKFVQAQPRLKDLEFTYICLATPGLGWREFAEALPTGVQSWKVLRNVCQWPLPDATILALRWETRSLLSSRWLMTILEPMFSSPDQSEDESGRPRYMCTDLEDVLFSTATKRPTPIP